MKALDRLRSAGQSLWMDHVTREHIRNGTLMDFIDNGVVTGISLTPQATGQTISSSQVYHDRICKKLGDDLWGEALVFDLILEDIHHAADLLRHVFERTEGIDGWAALPVSPLLTSDPDALLDSVLVLHRRVNRKNVLITVPGLPDMLRAIEEIVFVGIPINISLIYSSDQCLGVVEACRRGVERRISAGIKPAVPVFISVPVSQLAAALANEMAQQESARTTIAVARKIYATMRMLHTSQQWERAYSSGARPLRLVWLISDEEPASTSDISLGDHLVAPFTVVSMSKRDAIQYFRHGCPEEVMPQSDEDSEEILSGQQKAGLDLQQLTDSLQEVAATSQVKNWITLLDIVAKSCADLIQQKSIMSARGEN